MVCAYVDVHMYVYIYSTCINIYIYIHIHTSIFFYHLPLHPKPAGRTARPSPRTRPAPPSSAQSSTRCSTPHPANCCYMLYVAKSSWYIKMVHQDGTSRWYKQRYACVHMQYGSFKSSDRCREPRSRISRSRASCSAPTSWSLEATNFEGERCNMVLEPYIARRDASVERAQCVQIVS